MLGVGAAETISNDLILSAVPPTKAGAASAISETAYEVGAVLGTAVLGSILTAGYRNGIVAAGGLWPGRCVRRLGNTGRRRRGGRDAARRPQAANCSPRPSPRSIPVVATSLIGIVLMVAAAVGAVFMLRRVAADKDGRR